MRATLRDPAEKAQRLESGLGPLLRQRVVGGGIREALTGAVHGRPQAIVIAVVLYPLRLVARTRQCDAIHIAVGRAPMMPIDFIFEKLRHFGQRYRPPLDESDSLGCGKPGIATARHSDAPHIVIRQPTQTLTVLPVGSIESKGSTMRSQPDDTV